MDTAVSLVNAYLHINGFLTATEYPLLETASDGTARTATDLDVLAFRFPHAGRELAVAKGKIISGNIGFAPDPVLGGSVGLPDMIIGEVKRGRARFNPATRHPEALAAALMRFGCCPDPEARNLARKLVKRGHAQTIDGHQIRMVAFGGIEPEEAAGGWRVVSLAHVIGQLRSHLAEQWSRVRHAQFGNPVLDLLALLELVESERASGRGMKSP